jgi:hypothetical protein
MGNREAFNNEAKSWTVIYANPDTAK